ncbi:MAG: 50S ribosomal protein L3 [Candidatus Edwardsbacteria bacterium RIFOXYD12_FULL_50_11]|uniref:Large ribosomal subunit protein uL3 n=1 Tax=Candidatus Edwardsbacteria bacterium GWF2_54_11 TaxID=1817851 RepID=A0A1F5RJ93_9BACT|nr:ribosomal protein L3 [uncultured bacterium]OGF04622.1 MAG: 50S ribosomal protein L3 [Candidatus Edwardsbacteria bacterium RifOxyC12_full_54_24]OGF06011.1 MAG: 50S ribosomal protein L3 [Candidatus Edwardsbacteria bacterium RifOxyA12_full_54_48]OGF11820.1 MAG: 50S ribosomal protein L3 [Candidatus Edwardsbacteria bacterium GWE2_54_12]OGF14243.1 MAG: 50S ribosomal protein L3 [Candidatus Edwardsbacteria bacterium GWF2_54_11]OGF16547.1 MAG: 50S ribosomal protein L3 [Candidatus Edwardsbacteria bac
MNAMIGRKIGMTQVFGESNVMVPVTVLEVGPCVVTQIKTKDKDGYSAVQLGFGSKKPGKVNKPITGHLAKSKAQPVQVMQEFRVDDTAGYQLGQVITADIFAAGDRIKVAGTTKGKGTAGVMKRHKFHGGPASHGQTDRNRHAGAVGSGSSPGRVYPGTKMAGHMGDVKFSVRNLKVVKVDQSKNIILVKGAVPGAPDGILSIHKI